MSSEEDLTHSARYNPSSENKSTVELYGTTTEREAYTRGERLRQADAQRTLDAWEHARTYASNSPGGDSLNSGSDRFAGTLLLTVLIGGAAWVWFANPHATRDSVKAELGKPGSHYVRLASDITVPTDGGPCIVPAGTRAKLFMASTVEEDGTIDGMVNATQFCHAYKGGIAEVQGAKLSK